MTANLISQDDLLAAIRTAVNNTGGERLNIGRFLTMSGLRRIDVYHNYATWSAALVAAGFDFEPFSAPVHSDTLLADWGSVVRKLKRVPACDIYRLHGKCAPGTIRTRFGSWNNVRRAFRLFAQGKPEWDDVLEWCPELPFGAKPNDRRWETRRHSRQRKQATPLDDRTTYGEPIDFPGLRNAPTNETGVVLVFGILAERLGFRVQSVQTAFPDCEALRCVTPGSWQTVKIEFEYQSANFLHHKHPPEGCDIIVCWEHNWKDCPPNLEVIALSEQIQRLQTNPV